MSWKVKMGSNLRHARMRGRKDDGEYLHWVVGSVLCVAPISAETFTAGSINVSAHWCEISRDQTEKSLDFRTLLR